MQVLTRVFHNREKSGQADIWRQAMKRHIFSVLLALTFVFSGLQAVFIPADAAASRGNAAPFETLPAELQNLDVKDDFVDSGATQAGFLQTVVGHVVVLHEDSGEVYFAAAGDAVFRHDTIFTLPDSRCRLKFTTEDVITMGENAKLGLEEYIDNRPRKKKKSIFNMLRGKAMFYAVRLFKYRTTSTTVKTPTAVIGVRGTKFGVEVRKEGDKIASSSPLYLADASDALLMHLLSQAIPGGTITETHCFSGALDVTALADNTTQTLGDNESRTTTSDQGLNKQPTSFDKAQEFQSDTAAPAPGEEGAGQAETQTPVEGAGVSVTDTGGGTATDTDLADKAEDQTSTITDQTLNIEGSAPTRPTVHKGYFTGMLTQDSSDIKTFQHLYLSQSLQNLDSSTAKAHDSLIPGGGDLILDGSDPSNDGEIIVLEVPPETITGFPYPIQVIEMGFNQYMEWGYWTQAQPMPDNSEKKYLFDNRGYRVVGDFTHDSKMNSLIENNFSGTYSGTAYGTYWTATSGADMSGTFSAQINFGAAIPITNFGIHIFGDGHTVDISGAEGQFTDPNHPSHFVVPSGATGTWKIDGVNADTGIYEKIAYGSVYGSNAEAIGGVWKIDTPAPGHATGMFQGNR